jgi:arginyl-tRNA synthetase
VLRGVFKKGIVCVKYKLDLLLRSTIDECFEKGVLNKTPLPDYVIEIPNNPAHGHLATNLPLTLASSQHRSPREIAKIITDHLKDEHGLLENWEIAGPGFINFFIRAKEWYRILSDVVSLKGAYGQDRIGDGQRVLVEFVSANPTGPLHLGHGRGAALGDTLCRVLSFCGYDVVREFYINDAGQQIKVLGESIFSRFKQLNDPEYPFPENGYQGDYVLGLAKDISEEVNLESLTKEEAIQVCTKKGKEIMLEEIRQDLHRFRVAFDVWSSENELASSGLLQGTLSVLSEKGLLYEEAGALWIRTTDFGDDKDRVIRKKDGQFTYFASDITYHLEKQKRGFAKAIDIWGADHHGYIPRVKAALLSHGIPEDWLSVMLIQLVKLWKGGQEVKMSKRAGNFVTLQELLDEVGVDAVRFVFLTKNHDSPLDFDIDMVKKEDSDNPVYYVQYAHARICSIFRKAEDAGISIPEKPDRLLDLLSLDEEMALIRAMAEFPTILVEICKKLEPHRLTYYLTDLASSFHKYFNMGTKIPEYRIITPERELSVARLILAEGVRTVIANGLRLLGISAPQRM